MVSIPWYSRPRRIVFYCLAWLAGGLGGSGPGPISPVRRFGVFGVCLSLGDAADLLGSATISPISQEWRVVCILSLGVAAGL